MRRTSKIKIKTYIELEHILKSFANHYKPYLNLPINSIFLNIYEDKMQKRFKTFLKENNYFISYVYGFALIWYSAKNDIELVKCLLMLGASVDIYHNEALRNAIIYGNTEVVNILFEHGAELRLYKYNFKSYALNRGYMEIYKRIKQYLYVTQLNNKKILQQVAKTHI